MIIAKIRRVLVSGALCAAFVLFAGCQKEAGPTVAKKATAVEKVAGAKQTAGAKQAVGAKVAKVIFVGKEKACDCTRTRVDLGWVTLKKALGEPSRVPVERLRSDADPIQVAGLRQKKAMVTLPAVYFLDGKGDVVKLLQGELKAEQVLAALGGR